ncbi:hypothetical protein JTB14_024192 [Gonioctena quinquepunctata]|nr:hypothetical protein JTB14_024192 [Gonioctena quinquepunctata]
MGYTALHYAVKQRDEALIQYLLDCKNVDLEVVTYGGRDVLEDNKILPAKIKSKLRNRGVPSPFSSEDEDEFDSEDEDDEMYENNLSFNGTLVGASA